MHTPRDNLAAPRALGSAGRGHGGIGSLRVPGTRTLREHASPVRGRSAPRPPQCPRPSHVVCPGLLGTPRGRPGRPWPPLTFWIRFSAMGQAAGAAAGPRVPGCRLAGLLRVRPGAVRECAGGGAGLFCFRLRCWEGACALPAAPRPPGTLGSVVPGLASSAARADVVQSPVGDS